mgnify:FL=1
MAKPDRHHPQTEWENPGVSGLPKAKRGHHDEWISFMNRVLDAVVEHEVYSFHDGLNGYNQIRMHPRDMAAGSAIV